jgi:Ca2+-dependent lipid-binding protein
MSNYDIKSLKDKLPSIKIQNVVGTNLVSCDLNGKSDPFIRIGFNDKCEFLDKKKGILFQSEPKYESLEFDHKVDKEFVVQLGHSLQIEIWDKDSLSKSDWMGCVMWKMDDALTKGMFAMTWSMLTRSF